MKRFVNNAEKAAYSLQADKTEILKSTADGATVTTVYEGNCLSETHQLPTDSVWDIRRTVITETADAVEVDEKWAETDHNAWTDRATLTYVYR